jgi:hypothetical protein
LRFPGEHNVQLHPSAIPLPLGNAEMVGVCPRRRISSARANQGRAQTLPQRTTPVFQNFILFEEFQIALPLKRIGTILRAN